MSEQMKEPWGINERTMLLCDASGRSITSTPEVMRRIVACVNACAGMPIEQIERNAYLQIAGEIRSTTVKELKQKLASAEKDTERLNWLESNPRHAQMIIDGQVTDCVFYGISCAQLIQLRDAIDSAMKE